MDCCHDDMNEEDDKMSGHNHEGHSMDHDHQESNNDEHISGHDHEKVEELFGEDIKQVLINLESEELPIGARVFKVEGQPWIFFDIEQNPDIPKLLIVRHDEMELLGGLTVLYDGLQIERGVHEKTLNAEESRIGVAGSLPRLEPIEQASS